MIFLVKTHEENNNRMPLDSHMKRVSIGTWNPFPVCLCLTSVFDYSRQNARRKQQQNATPSRNLSSNPPKKSVHWNEKIGEIIFKSFFGEATKLQEILCHQKNAKQRKKNITIIISNIHYYYQYVHQWCGNLSFVFHTDCDAKHDKKK